MALNMSVEFKGIDCRYHKIMKREVEYRHTTMGQGFYTKMDVWVGLFINAAARATSVDNVLRTKHYSFFRNEFVAPEDDKLEKVYKALKELPEYSTANDA